MEELIKNRKTKAAKLTRVINELLNAVSTKSAIVELEEKISNVKIAMGDVASINDQIIDSLPDEDIEALERQYK